jgi:serine protease Do
MIHEFTNKSLAVFTSIAIVSGVIGGGLTERFFDDDAMVSNGDVVQPVKMELVDEKSAVIDAIQKVSPSVVSIVITQELTNIRNQGMSPFDLFFKDDPFFNDFFGEQQFETPAPQPETEDDEPIRQKVGGGSGFIVTKEGMIMTNRHVVARDDVDYTVILHDGSEFKAQVVSRDLFNDIAIIELVAEEDAKLPELRPVSLGSSADLKIGQSVIAIGNALAEFANSATRGIVSAKGRQIVASDGQGRGENLSGLLQTDAAINPGNSGGPLINLAGEVVGVNTAIASGANGIGFAIPIDDVKPVLKSVEEHGRIVRPILGVMFTMLTPELAKELNLTVEEGAILKGDGQSFAVLPGKPAEKAGLLEKDVIVEVNGAKITTKNPLQQEIMKYAPGDKITVKYLRNGEEKETEITLGEAETDVKKEE